MTPNTQSLDNFMNNLGATNLAGPRSDSYRFVFSGPVLELVFIFLIRETDPDNDV